MNRKCLEIWQVRSLCDKWQASPGIVRGILAAWRADGAPSSLVDVFELFPAFFRNP